MAKKKRTFKRELIEWGIIIGIGLTLYVTGYHTEVIGRLQQLLLFTGFREPDLITEVSDRKTGSYDVELYSGSDNRISMDQFRGKVIFINLWASWCPPCVAEMPSINDLYQSAKNDSIVFLMISLDQDRKKALDYVKRKEFNFPVYFPAKSLPLQFQSETIPTTFVLDKNGNIAVEERGLANYDNADFRNFLKLLANEE